MEKISQVQVGEMMKLAGTTIQKQQVELREMKEKVAHYEKKERVEKVAHAMEQKGLEPELSFEDKVAGLMKKDNLDVIEEAVGMSAPQMKLASVQDDDQAPTDGDVPSSMAEQQFLSNLNSV